MLHSINVHPPRLRNCVLCANFVCIVGSDAVRCFKFGCASPAREMQCAFWEREPGADDESDVGFWRQVMERLYPPRQCTPLQPRTPEETRTIMGLNYRCSAASATPIDPIDAEDEAAALAEVLGPVAYAENRF